MKRSSILTLFTILGCILVFANNSSAIFFTVPNVSAGNTNAYEPFALELLGIPSCRYQQVYDASAFGSSLPGGGMISGIGFASDGIFGRSFAARLDVEIILSVTPREPDQLSTIFADNVGANVLTVLPRSLVLVTCSGAGQSFGISFANPYFYNPAQGNLLLEVRDYSQQSIPGDPFTRVSAMDAQNTFGDTVSRVFAYDVSATTGTADTFGLLTILPITPVPEPATWLLLLSGVAIGAVRRLRRRHASTRSTH